MKNVRSQGEGGFLSIAYISKQRWGPSDADCELIAKKAFENYGVSARTRREKGEAVQTRVNYFAISSGRRLWTALY